MRIRGFEINEKTMVLSLAAAYAAAVLIVLSVLVHDKVWHAVYTAL